MANIVASVNNVPQVYVHQNTVVDMFNSWKSKDSIDVTIFILLFPQQTNKKTLFNLP